MYINRYSISFNNLESDKRMEIIKLKNSSSFNRWYGAITITFFPISLICLPFIMFLIVFKSERLNDFVLKIQYACMILMYCFIGGAISTLLLPILYMKTIANQLYICFHNKRQDYRGQAFVHLVLVVFVNPVVILLSIVIDLLSLPTMLLKDSRYFEYKYQTHLDELSYTQTESLLSTFIKIFYVNFKQQYANKGPTLAQMMSTHLKIFRIQDNLYDLMCRGMKDYKDALANVQDYNMSKILTK